MGEIRGREKTVKELIAEKYAVDSYQREYKWEKKQLAELLQDLLGEFNDDYDEKHGREDVMAYGQYFLGPIIVSTEEDKQKYIVDGQQRLTTLTLMLICLSHMLDDSEHKGNLQKLIYADKFGKKTFNLNIDERTECLRALYDNDQFDVSNQPESVRYMIDRYKQMDEILDGEFSSTPNQIPLFVDWLIENVYLVEITTSASKDAYKIFETMNDRGLRLTPVEMLKSYLLREIRNEDRENANRSWKESVDLLIKHKEKGIDADFIKSWLRGRYADKFDDYVNIGSQFHRWVRDDDNNSLNLKSQNDFLNFIVNEFNIYSKTYLSLLKAADTFDASSGLQRVYYLAQHNFTLQYPMLLAPLTLDDTEQERQKKIRIVAAFLDILVHRRIGNNMQIDERKMRSKIFDLIRQIRNKSADEIATLLADELRVGKDQPTTTLEPEYQLNGQNKPRIKRILARITDYVERNAQIQGSSSYDKFSGQSFHIEHIWHSNYAKVCKEEGIRTSEIPEEKFLPFWRNEIGGLLLLPSSDNKSYGARSYTKKREYYRSQNLLAASLHEASYDAKPGLRKFMNTSGLPFEPHERFTVANQAQRQKLYRDIADRVWDPAILAEEASR